MASAPVPAPLPDAEYRRLCDEVFARIEGAVDRWLQEDVADIDSHRTGGLLELAFEDGGKIVVNSQPPLQEVWLAARTGGRHFRFVSGAWRDTRDEREFFEVLSQEATLQAKRTLVF